MYNQTNSKRLAKNTLFMYFRMGFLMLISLYTSRVVLQQLGVADYGIYNLVGSIVVMFTSLRAIFASSTQRFLSHEMGRGNMDKLQLIYTMSTFLNAIISVVFIILVEVVGIWFLEYKINVVPSRLIAAHWVFQFSVITTVIGMMSTPLDACVIAHERMDFYAYLSIFEGVAKLGICYLLAIFGNDKLITYGLLTLVVAVVIRIINQIFCMKAFAECHLKKCWDKQYFFQMTNFAGWAFFGNTANTLSQSGLNMVLNVFGGPIVNAARGISYQVQTALWQFVGNITIVVRPYSIKTYASGDITKALDLTYLISKVYYGIQLAIVVLVTFLADWLIKLWLGQTPEYTVVFLDLVMIQSLIRTLHTPIDMLFSGEGDIKYYQLVEGVVLALPVPISYVLLSLGYPYYTAFVSLVVCEVLHIASIALLASYICHLQIRMYLSRVICPCLLCSFVYTLMMCLNFQLGNHVIFKMINATFTMVLTSFVMYVIGFTNKEKQMLYNVIKRK